jgi:tetratricopeptide (TPR) repeat protein
MPLQEAPVTEPVAFKYRAFLSYSHRDTAWGKWLHAALEGYRIDRDLTGRETPAGTVPRSLRPIFRDREDFSAGHSLTEQTLAALEASQFLVVICSPNAAQSKYVNEEVRRFKMLGRAARVIPVIVDGEPGDRARECFPPALRCKVDADGEVTAEREEPIAADARPQGDGKDIAKQKVAAGLLGVGLDEIVRRAERARRRRNRFWAALAGVFLLLALAATGSAVYAWQQLRTNEAFLNATLKRATEIVDEAVAQAEKYNVPRTATLTLLRQAEGLFDDMAQYGRPTPELRYRKAWMLIQFARNYAILGDSVKQFARADEAYRLLAGLAGERPDVLTYQRDLAIAYDEIGRVQMEQGNLTGALQSFGESVAIMKRVGDADPGNVLSQHDLARSYSGLGDALVRQGRLDAALKSYRESLAIMQRIVSGNPADADYYYRDLAVAQGKIGDILKEQDDLTGALQAYREGTAIRERLAKTDPGNIRRQLDLAISYERLGNVLFVLNRMDDALKNYRDSVAINERLVKADPGNAIWQHALSASYGWVGDVLLAQGKPDDALKSYRDSLAIAERWAQTDPGSADWQVALAHCYSRVGLALAAQGHLSEAMEPYQRSLAILESLAETDPSNALWQRDLATFYGRAADAATRQGARDEALTYYRGILAIRERQAKADPGDTGRQWALLLAYDKVGDLLVEQGELDDALKSYRGSLGVAERRARNDPGNAGWQRGLMVGYGKIGAVLLEQGKLDDALRSHRDGLAIAERLAKADPGNADRQHDLSASQRRVGDVLVEQGELEDAFKSYRDSLAIMQRLTASDSSNAQWQQELKGDIGLIGSLAYRFVLARNFVRALEAADQATTLASGEIWIRGNRAHALMFLDRTDEARELYLKYRGAKNVVAEKSWETSVLEDFGELRKAGLAHPLMDEVEKTFATGG